MTTWNRESKWARSLVNLNQTPTQRKHKYDLALSLGVNPAHARRMRDWHENKIRRALAEIK